MIHNDSFIQPRQQPRSAAAFAAGVRRSQPLPYSPGWVDVREDAERLLTRLFQRPGLNLDQDALEARLARLDERSVQLFADAHPRPTSEPARSSGRVVGDGAHEHPGGELHLPRTGAELAQQADDLVADPPVTAASTGPDGRSRG